MTADVLGLKMKRSEFSSECYLSHTAHAYRHNRNISTLYCWTQYELSVWTSIVKTNVRKNTRDF